MPAELAVTAATPVPLSDAVPRLRPSEEKATVPAGYPLADARVTVAVRVAELPAMMASGEILSAVAVTFCCARAGRTASGSGYRAVCRRG